jgi:hypothetical protein
MDEKNKKPNYKHFYVYVIDATRTANQTIEENIKISTANHFVVTHIVGNSTGIYQVQFRDSGTNKHWQEGLMNNVNVVGSAQLPFELPHPRFVRAGATLYYNVKDTSGSGNTIQICLIGYELQPS